ncbi:MAG: tetratricopeptide repeat protein [Bacteroidetes bacterium]|nr:tetratricopeptide repeat protein [Bacteroidota bacterium]
MRKHLHYFLIVVVANFFGHAFGQEQTAQFKKSLDSLETILKTAPPDTNRVILLMRIANRNKNFNPERTLSCAQEALALSYEHKFRNGLFRSFEALTAGMKYTGRQKELLVYLDSWEKAGDSLGDMHQKAKSCNARGTILMDLGNYSKSAENYFKAIKIDEGLTDKYALAADYGNLALVYESMKKYELALEYVNKAMKIDKELGDKKGYLNAIGNLSNIYSYMGDNKKALEYDFEFLKLAEEIDNKMLVASALSNIGSIYDEMGDKDKAIDFYKRALPMAKEIGNDEIIIVNGINIGNLYLDKGQYDASIKMLQEALVKAEEIDLKFHMSECYRLMALAYRGKKEFANAYSFLDKYTQAKDTLLNAENSRQVNEMSARYEKDKQKLKIDALEKEKQLSSQVIEKQNNFRNVLIVVVVLIILLAGVLFMAFMTKQKANRLLELSNAEIQQQKDIIEEKNKSITDSIYYAKRIQTTLLPSEKYISKNMEKLMKKDQPKD